MPEQTTQEAQRVGDSSAQAGYCLAQHTHGMWLGEDTVSAVNVGLLRYTRVSLSPSGERVGVRGPLEIIRIFPPTTCPACARLNTYRLENLQLSQ